MHWYKKVKTDYYRDKLLKVFNNCERKPILLTAKYQDSNSINRMVFTNIKPYMFSICETHREKYKNYTFCKHITFLRNDIYKYIKLNSDNINKRFLIMVNLIKYKSNGIKRMGVELYKEDGIIPIMKLAGIRKNQLIKSLLHKFHKYREEDFTGCSRNKITLKESIISIPEEPPEDFVFYKFDAELAM